MAQQNKMLFTTDGAPSDSRRATALESARSPSARRWLSKAGLPLLICAFAFIFRFIYISCLQHQVCQFGDAFIFLAGASNLRELISNVIHTGNWHLLSSIPPASPDYLSVMRSTTVSDRLMNDGPIFPCYLALVQWLVGLAPGSLLFDGKSLQISIVNAVMDSITCLAIFLGTRLAFDRRAAYIAATLFALYPASIINTQSCYSEPFGCFAIAIWSWNLLAVFARDTTVRPWRWLQYLTLGFMTGVVALTKPLFVFLPVTFAVVFLALRLWHANKPLQLRVAPMLRCAAPLLVGFAIVAVPWLLFTHKITGNYLVCVNRSPSFNLYLGNQIERDGWRAYPFQDGIPNTVPETAKQILAAACKQPFSIVSLELRKIPRLWAGTWNEFQYNLFGIPVWWQEICHQVILGLSAVALMLLLTRSAVIKDKDAVISLAIATLSVHSLYVLFEPISRYAMTVMPIIVMLAGFILRTFSVKPRALVCCLIALGAPLLAINFQHQLLAACATAAGGNGMYWLAASFCVGLFAASVLLLRLALDQAKLKNAWLAPSIVGCFIVGCVLTISCIVSDPESTEWKATLRSPEESISQTIDIPKLSDNQQPKSAYLLLDMDQGQCPSPIHVSINGVDLSALPKPWWQIEPNADFLAVLGLQARAMGASPYAFRQWWTLQIPPEYIKFGSSNVVAISPEAGSTATIFGDYVSGEHATTVPLPSLQLASWTKGFATFDHHDPRVYETVQVAKTFSAFRLNGKWTDRDLSSDLGRQSGRYRVHLVVFPGSDTDKKISPKPFSELIVSMPAQRKISGIDLASMQMTTEKIDLRDHLAHPLAFALSCDLACSGSAGTAFVNVEFQGNDSSGRTKKWTSLWQPTLIRTSKDWVAFNLSDTLPGEISRLRELKTSITVCPFSPEQLYLHRKQAIKGTVFVRNLRLMLQPGQEDESSAPICLY